MTTVFGLNSYSCFRIFAVNAEITNPGFHVKVLFKKITNKCHELEDITCLLHLMPELVANIIN